jgi:hypothetical protein
MKMVKQEKGQESGEAAPPQAHHHFKTPQHTSCIFLLCTQQVF